MKIKPFYSVSYLRKKGLLIPSDLIIPKKGFNKQKLLLDQIQSNENVIQKNPKLFNNIFRIAANKADNFLIKNLFKQIKKEHLANPNFLKNLPKAEYFRFFISLKKIILDGFFVDLGKEGVNILFDLNDEAEIKKVKKFIYKTHPDIKDYFENKYTKYLQNNSNQ
jgi:hypothetical protein